MRQFRSWKEFNQICKTENSPHVPKAGGRCNCAPRSERTCTVFQHSGCHAAARYVHSKISCFFLKWRMLNITFSSFMKHLAGRTAGFDSVSTYEWLALHSCRHEKEIPLNMFISGSRNCAGITGPCAQCKWIGIYQEYRQWPSIFMEAITGFSWTHICAAWPLSLCAKGVFSLTVVWDWCSFIGAQPKKNAGENWNQAWFRVQNGADWLHKRTAAKWQWEWGAKKNTKKEENEMALDQKDET